MKEFLKWLGVDNKIAKLAAWILIIMITLIIVNVFLESMGFPYYKITVENLSKNDYGEVVDLFLQFVLSAFNFYAIILLVVRVKDIKKTIKYALLYLILNTIVVNVFDYAIAQIFIFVYIIFYLFLYGNKNKKYLLYGIGSIIFNILIQYVLYLYKGRFLDFTSIGTVNTLITSLDYFIIMTFIIIVKEIYLSKKLKKWGEIMQGPACLLWWPKLTKEQAFAKKMAKKLANRK